MSKKDIDTSALKVRGGAMRLTLQAGVANDLSALRKGLKDLAERLGHPACATGCNEFHLNLERDFVVQRNKAAVALNPQPLPPLPQDPIPWKAVRVSMPGAAFDDINSLGTAIERVLGRLGCPSCCSGFDILFQRELDGFALDAKLDVRGTGRFA